MSKIIPRIYKNKIGKELRYPIKYTDLEACFLSRSTDDVYLDVYFTDRQAYWKTNREQLEAEGRYNLVEIDYDPEKPDFLHSNAPWQDIEDPIVVHIQVYAIAHSVAVTCCLERTRLRSILSDQVHKLMPGGLPSQRWRLRVVLLAKSRLLECTTKVWRGLGQESETERLISVDHLEMTFENKK
jgi:hypothetical protein